jgi:uncharacterized protein YbcV (DUF1398 family)
MPRKKSYKKSYKKYKKNKKGAGVIDWIKDKA